MPRVLDMSSHSQITDGNAIRRDYSGAIIRIGYGVDRDWNQKDGKFNEFYDKLNNGSFPLGAYYYSYAKQPSHGINEADNAISYIENRRNFKLPIFYNIENNSFKSWSDNDLTTLCENFIKRIYANGLIGGIAATGYLLNKIDQNRLKKYPMWRVIGDGDYNGGNRVMYQEQAGQVVDGGRNVDFNNFYVWPFVPQSAWIHTGQKYTPAYTWINNGQGYKRARMWIKTDNGWKPC